MKWTNIHDLGWVMTPNIIKCSFLSTKFFSFPFLYQFIKLPLGDTIRLKIVQFSFANCMLSYFSLTVIHHTQHVVCYFHETPHQFIWLDECNLLHFVQHLCSVGNVGLVTICCMCDADTVTLTNMIILLLQMVNHFCYQWFLIPTNEAFI